MFTATTKLYFSHLPSLPGNVPLRRSPPYLRLPIRPFPCFAVHPNYVTPQTPSSSSEPSISSQYTSAVGSPPLQLSHLILTQRHVTLLSVFACATAISATWLFCAAIPTLLAFKRAAESMEKLMDAAREELPETMAAVRLSGMEISDLTVELSDLSQELTQGVKGSTKAVRVAEERLQQLANMTSTVPMQAITVQKTETAGPWLATGARSMREGIVKGRTMLTSFFTLMRFSRLAFNYFSKRARQ